MNCSIMDIKVTVKLDGSLLQNYFDDEGIVELHLPQGATLGMMQDELLSKKSIKVNKELFFGEHMFIVNYFLADNYYLLKDQDEVIILPWLIAG